VNAREIVSEYTWMEKELKELKKALDVLEEEVGKGSKAYHIIKTECENKQRELNIFGNTEWGKLIKLP
jgi:hypothetical protein